MDSVAVGALAAVVGLLIIYWYHTAQEKYTVFDYSTRSLVPYDGATALTNYGSYPWGLVRHP